MQYLFTKANFATGLIAAYVQISHAHVVLAVPTAPAGSSYRATLQVGHGCEKSATTGIKVMIPAGFMGAKPMPRPGWVVTTRTETLAKPYKRYDREVTEDVVEIAWTAVSKESWLPDAHYDEFVLRGTLSGQIGPMWFKVLQQCEKGSNDWVDVPSSGTSTKGMKTPAALLEVVQPSGSAHQH